jgi:hypothetical protein
MRSSVNEEWDFEGMSGEVKGGGRKRESSI